MCFDLLMQGRVTIYSDEINKIFNMMKRLDSEHFDSMEKWAKQEMRQNL